MILAFNITSGDDVKMRVARVAASVAALCLVTGLIVYGGVFLWPGLAGSNPVLTGLGIAGDDDKSVPEYLYAIGSEGDGPVRPNAVAVDGKDRVYITDAGTARIFIYSSKGRKISEFGGRGNGKEEFGFPNGLVVAGDGSLIIADSVKKNIRVFSPEGKYIRTIMKSTAGVKPGSLTRSDDGIIYVSDLMNSRVLAVDEKGKVLREVPNAREALSYPQGTAVDGKGRLWVADSGNFSVSIFDHQGIFIKKITGGGDPETPFSMVRGIAVDKAGKVYISDTISHHIRVFDSTGRQISVFPGAEDGEASLVFPTGIFIHSDGRLYVVDRGAGDVKVFSAN